MTQDARGGRIPDAGRPSGDGAALPVPAPAPDPTAGPDGGSARGRPVRELTADETQEAERMVAELAEAEARTDGRPLLAVLKAHLALNQMPGGPYAVALVGALALLVVLMTGLTVLGLLV